MRVRISDSLTVHLELLLGGFPRSAHAIAGADSGDRNCEEPVTGRLLVGVVALADLPMRDRVPPLDRWIADDLYAPGEQPGHRRDGRSLRPNWRSGALAVGTVAVLVVSASRLLLGEHYLVDVVAVIVATLGVGLLASTALRLPLATSYTPSIPT